MPLGARRGLGGLSRSYSGPPLPGCRRIPGPPVDGSHRGPRLDGRGSLINFVRTFGTLEPQGRKLIRRWPLEAICHP